MFGRTWKASIAKDNGRTEEFIKRKDYPDKSRCFECGEVGHLSYQCPQNALGTREPPLKKKKVKKRGRDEMQEPKVQLHEDVDDLETLGAAIRYEVVLLSQFRWIEENSNY